ncbi:MAG: hypothetical protein PSN34_06125 [Urechidicola sp.]|nr:hypothetical protein [Urechidicola sp.]
MKKILIITAATLLIFTSCQYSVDRTDIYNVGDALHESFIQKDTTILKQVFVHQMDSISKKQKDKIAEIQSFFKPDLKIIKMDTSSFWSWNWLNIYYKKSAKFYELSAEYSRDSLGNISVSNLYIENINEKCESDLNKPYCPKNDVEFKRISWTSDYYEKTFKSGEVFFKNNSDNDFNYIKFRVILKNGTSQWSAETFFNQTVESYKPSYKGDITSAKIPGMENYYTGFKIKKDNLFFDAELIEVLPKPESSWCKKLEELKDEIINKSE